jgi:hypothetical protein
VRSRASAISDSPNAYVEHENRLGIRFRNSTTPIFVRPQTASNLPVGCLAHPAPRYDDGSTVVGERVMVNQPTVIDRTLRSSRSLANAWISALLTCFLVIATLLVANLATNGPLASSHDANAPQSIQTIRRFYAGLNEFMETGDPTTVSQTLAPGALAFVPEHGAIGDGSALLTWLLALRSTAPERRFSIDSIDAGDDLAIATVRQSDTAATSPEFFRVRSGRIVQHWSAAPGSVLQHTLTTPPMRAELPASSHLAIAALTFPSGWSGPLPIDGPALILVQQGSLTLEGDGASQILDIATGQTTISEPSAHITAHPGQAILIPQGRAVPKPNGLDSASALIAALATDQPTIPASYPADRPLPQIAINDRTLMGGDVPTQFDAVHIRPLALDHRATPAGTWEFAVSWAILDPGASLPLPTDTQWAITYLISGSANHLDPEALLTNTSNRPALTLLVQLNPAP